MPSSSACAAILAMEEIPHWDHVDDILTIRGYLMPDGYWDDVSDCGRQGGTDG